MTIPELPPPSGSLQRSNWVCSNVTGGTIDFIAGALEDAGRPAGVVAVLGEEVYRRGLRGGWLARMRVRISMYALYPVKLAWRVLTAPAGSTFVVTSNCFFAPLLATFCRLGRDVRVVHLLFDLFPDAFEAARGRPLPAVLGRVFGLVARATQRRSDAVVYLGERLRCHAERRWGGNSVSGCIDVGTDERLYPRPHGLRASGGRVVVRYGGQLGVMHDAALVETCLRRWVGEAGPDVERVEFLFLASGAGARWLKARLEDLGLRIEAPLEGDWRTELVRASLGLVSLSPQGATICLPSKAYGMLAGSQAVVAVCPAWSDLARIVQSHACGWIVNNSPFSRWEELEGSEYEDRIRALREPAAVAADFVRVIREIAANPAEVARRGANGRRAAELCYSRAAIGKLWVAILDRLWREPKD